MATESTPVGPPLGKVASGCLLRLMLFFVLVLIAAVGVVFLFGRALFQGHWPN